MRFIILFLCVVIVVGSVSGQPEPAQESSTQAVPQDLHQTDGWLKLLSVPSGAEVFLDSAFIGRTPIDRQVIPHGRHRVKVIYPSASAWNAVAREETLEVSPGAQVEKVFELGTVLSLNTVPAGARVTHQGVELGTTPMFYRSLSPLTGELKLAKPGYVPYTVSSQKDSIGSTPIRLRPIHQSEASDYAEVFASNSTFGRQDIWPTVAAGSALLVSGVLAAYLKDQANSRFDEYVRTKDGGLLNSTNRLDRQSAAALIVSELSFAVLTYLLLFE